MSCIKTAYPTGSDVQHFMRETGLLDMDTSTTWDWNMYAGAGVEEFERAVSRRMLAGIASPRNVDSPEDGTRIVRLDADLCGISSVSLSGTVLVRETQYKLHPRDAEYDQKPWNAIELRHGWYPGRWGNIIITGLWGRWTCIPDDAWLTMVRLAARRVIPQIAAGVTQGLTSWQESDVQESYAEAPFNFMIEDWNQQDFGDGKTNFGVIGRYKRVAQGV